MNSLSHRLRTFTSLKWALKPISPLTLAKLGYCCVGLDVLECSCCKFTFELSYITKSKPEKEETILISKTLLKADEGHSQDCLFRDKAQGSVDDTNSMTNEDRVFFIERHFLSHYDGLVELLTEYPLLSQSSFLYTLKQSEFELLWLKDTLVRESKQFDCAAILALMGYQAKSNTTLQCCFCFKEVNLDFFIKSKERVQRLEIETQDQTDDEKIETIMQQTEFSFDPSVFHRQHCPWVAPGQDGTWRGALAALKIKYDSTKRGLSSFKKFKQIADQLRVIRTGYRKGLETTAVEVQKEEEVEHKEEQEDKKSKNVDELEERVNKRLMQFREKLERAKEAQTKVKRNEISMLKEAVAKQYDKVFNK